MRSHCKSSEEEAVVTRAVPVGPSVFVVAVVVAVDIAALVVVEEENRRRRRRRSVGSGAVKEQLRILFGCW